MKSGRRAGGHPAGPSVAVDMVKALLHYANMKGVDMAGAAAASGIEQAMLEDPGGRVPAGRFEALWNALAERYRDPFAGLHFGEAFAGLIEGHFLYAMMMSSPTVGSALRIFFRYHCLMSDAVQPSLSVGKGRARITLAGPAESGEPRRQLAEATSAIMSSLLRRLAGGRIEFSTVSFRHDPPGDTREYSRVFGENVLFGRKSDELVFAENIVSAPMLLPNREVMDALGRLAEGLSERLFSRFAYSRKVLQKISDALLSGRDCSLPAVAASFALGPRQMQNLLRRDNTSYRALLERVKKETALHYMGRADVSLCEIAFILGFSEQSAFNHAFRKWAGCSPSEYRKK